MKEELLQLMPNIISLLLNGAYSCSYTCTGCPKDEDGDCPMMVKFKKLEKRFKELGLLHKDWNRFDKEHIWLK